MLRERDDFESGGWQGPVCRSCGQAILPDERATHIAFDNDRYGFKGLTGDYHLACSKPFSSLARVINMKPFN